MKKYKHKKSKCFNSKYKKFLLPSCIVKIFYNILHIVQLSIILLLYLLLNLKDTYTAAHCIRVMRLAVSFAEYNNYTFTQIKILKYSALLHDIGKLLIPKKILAKNKKLTHEEYAIIKKHSYYGYIITKYIVGKNIEAEVIKHHHERVDGKGYPDGLKGNKINDLSKLLSICDAFDAMTSTRSYRKKLSFEDALIELQANAENQFDKNILNKFIYFVNSKSNSCITKKIKPE
ncbi:HD-GYP domain-containing protein [Thermoanaerobacterium thermosaccharolyticum]|uniref:HD-GYP domain-containing protein n=1 Tax=Thermoanaerobacterium thermosaccharolyticum TaxID=1517 RepID=UPI0027A7C97A|nr:HD-GYP domain-containing protein [Thermoanaerobacterium thermosaccharolyticum]